MHGILEEKIMITYVLSRALGNAEKWPHNRSESRAGKLVRAKRERRVGRTAW